MRLIDPGAGEKLDRLTILALKIRHGREGGGTVNHFEAERAAILGSRSPSAAEAFLALEAVIDLAVVNACLWQAEDALRAYAPGFTEREAGEIARVALRIQRLNDERARLVEAINRAYNDYVGPEKLR